MAKNYRVLCGLDYPGKGGLKRAEPGDVVSDLPRESVGWLIEQGAVEEVRGDGVRTQQEQPGDGE
ncbi:hypothetical protein [Nonomuraea typhae]|uniref:hypothetical protein n=1 Tax=Nonomuraea typhae TaxID=2603600 RepID=UPI0012F758FA|nr:hypothetical protein [Nonomuraea typhae]